VLVLLGRRACGVSCGHGRGHGCPSGRGHGFVQQRTGALSRQVAGSLTQAVRRCGGRRGRVTASHWTQFQAGHRRTLEAAGGRARRRATRRESRRRISVRMREMPWVDVRWRERERACLRCGIHGRAASSQARRGGEVAAGRDRVQPPPGSCALCPVRIARIWLHHQYCLQTLDGPDRRDATDKQAVGRIQCAQMRLSLGAEASATPATLLPLPRLAI
jgi:hypothetical protein